MRIQALQAHDAADSDTSNPRDNAWPTSLSKLERDILLDDFVTLHLSNFKLAIVLLQYARRPDTIDTRREFVLFDLAYRHDSEGNPAKMFHLQRIKICVVEASGEETVHSQDEETGRNDGDSAAHGVNHHEQASNFLNLFFQIGRAHV